MENLDPDFDENSRDDGWSCALILPNRVLVAEQEIQIHTSVILEILVRRGIYDSLNPSKDLTVGDTSALSADSKVWQLHAL